VECSGRVPVIASHSSHTKWRDIALRVHPVRKNTNSLLIHRKPFLRMCHDLHHPHLVSPPHCALVLSVDGGGSRQVWHDNWHRGRNHLLIWTGSGGNVTSLREGKRCAAAFLCCPRSACKGGKPPAVLMRMVPAARHSLTSASGYTYTPKSY